MASETGLRPANVLSIDAGRPFLPTLADGLLDGRIVADFRFDPADPAALADVTVLLPTRRAARRFREALLDAVVARGGGRAILMPDVRPFGDVEGDEDLLGGGDVDLVPVVPPLERRLALTRLVMGWTRLSPGADVHPTTGAPPSLPASPAEAVRLAGALATLMDQVESQGVDWTRLADVVPEEHALYWQMTRRFLAIVAEAWPRHLAEIGRDDPTRRRHAAVRAAAARLAANPPRGPVIAAGSTGSVPSTAELIATVARLPRGAVVLPGLDFDLDAAAWAALEPDPKSKADPVPAHPQYGLRLLLDKLGLDRDAVRPLGEDRDPTAATARRRLLCEAMRPAATTDAWTGFAAEITQGAFPLGDALDGLSLLEARSEAEEAVAVAIALRAAIEDPDATAALVTPDRNLARRVAAELARWGLEIDDSAGRPLGHTPPAALVRLVGEVALAGWTPTAVASLIGHPLARFGRDAATAARLGRVIELVALRGPRPTPHGAGLLAAFDEAAAALELGVPPAPRPRARISADERAEARAMLVDMVAMLAPLEALGGAGEQPLALWLERHVAVARAVATDDTGDDGDLFAGEEGEALAAALAAAIAAAAGPGTDVPLAGGQWPGFLDALIGDAPVNRRTAPNARLFVFGPLEARLLDFDLVVLAGLDEGVWPITTRSDPWLSRPMRRDLRLEAPERRIGLSAHDFVQGAAAPRVLLARAEKAGGTPTVPSRWLQRIATLIGPTGLAAAKREAADWTTLARMIDRVDGLPRPVGRPAPRPPVELRPERASVTEIETWIRDPYAIFARRILKLDPLDPLGSMIGAAERGTFLHEVLARFVAEGRSPRGATAVADLIALGEEALAAFDAFPEVVALWRPRLAAVARWFVAEEAAREPITATRLPEIRGALELPVDGRTFLLTGRADRIDLRSDGSVALYDYKTGRPPSEAQVQSLLSPQLALETAMLVAGAFDTAAEMRLSGRPIAEIAYLHLKGGREGGVHEPRALPPDGRDPLALAEAAREELIAQIRAFRRPETGYPSRPRVQFEKARAGDYDHLARVAEWAAGDGAEGGEG